MAKAISTFLHKGPFSRRLRQCIADLAALGLVGESIWIDAEDPATGVLIGNADEGKPFYGNLSQLLNKVGGVPVHVVTLNVLGQDQGAGTLVQEHISSLQQEIRNTGVSELQGADSANVIVAEVGARVGKQLPTIAGFRNLLLAPEESESPDIPASEIFKADNNAPEEFALSVACKLAGLCGLWKGANTIPVAEQSAGEGLRLVRTYYRRVDAQEIQAQLKEQIFDVAQLPKVSTTPAGQPLHVTSLPNLAGMNPQIAQQIVLNHAEKIEPKKKEAESEATKQQKNRQVIKNIGSLYLRNLVRWPAISLQNFAADVKDKIDTEVQKLLGPDSAVRTGSGVPMPVNPPVGKETVTAASTFKPDQYTDLWKEYVDTSLALADADLRGFNKEGKQVPPYLRAPNQALNTARTASEIIPGPSAAFTANDLPAALRGRATELPLQPYDIKGIRGFEEKLRTSDFRGAHEGVQRFQAWKRKNSQSLASRFGEQLVIKEDQLWNRFAQERETYYAQLAEEGRTTQTSNAPSMWRWLGYVVFWSGAIFALAWGIGNWWTDATNPMVPRWMFAQNLNEAPAKVKAWMFGIWFVLWLVCWLIQVWLETRVMFATYNKRVKIRTALEAAAENMNAAESAYVQIQHGYLQFLSISKIYGSLLERPFGTIASAKTKSPVPMNQMPASVRITEAVSDKATIDKFVDAVRKEYYRQGWLEERVDAGLKRAFEMVNASYGDQGGDKHSFLRFRGEDSQELLDLLAKAMTSPQFVEADRTGEKWDKVVQRIERNDNHSRDELLSKQQMYRAGSLAAAREMPALANVKDAGSFNGTFVTSTGWAGGSANVIDASQTQHSISRQTGDQVGVAELLVQFGHPGDRSSFVFAGDEAGAMLGNDAPTPTQTTDPTAGNGGLQLPGLD